jgi:hypothetical protein
MARKSGPKDVGPSARGSSTAFNTGGGPGRSFAQGKIPGPVSPGQPTSMRKALAKKSSRGTVTGAAGTLR